MKQVIKFYADWCGPCKVYAPIFDKVVEDLNVEHKSVNIDKDTTGLAAKYLIRSIPATVLVENDKVLNKAVGLLNEGTLIKFINHA